MRDDQGREGGIREDGMNEGPSLGGGVKTATEMVKGSRLVEGPGAYDPERPDPAPEPVTLPEPRLLNDYTTAPC